MEVVAADYSIKMSKKSHGLTQVRQILWQASLYKTNNLNIHNHGIILDEESGHVPSIIGLSSDTFKVINKAGI